MKNGKLSGNLNGELSGELIFETLSSNEKKVYNAIKESPLSSRLSLIETVQIPARTFDRTVKSLIEKGFLIRVGSKKLVTGLSNNILVECSKELI